MVGLVTEKHAEVQELCRAHGVARLEVFGSAADGSFDPSRSDLDFIVEFEPLEPGALADAYFGLLEGLKRLFARHVDLVTPKAIRNPYFLKSLNETRQLLYAA